jgi:hypothetical protein
LKGNVFVTCGRIGVEGGSLMLSLDIPKTVGSLRSAGVSAKSASVNDIRELQRRLKAIDPAFRKALLRQAKESAKPVQKAIKDRLGSVTPPSGMERGRLNWNASTDAKGRVHSPTDVKIEFRTKSSGSRLVTSLVRVRAASPAVAMADMAGRSGRFIDSGYKGTGRTKMYKWKNTERMHRVNGQGRALIRALGGKASRFVYPAAEASLPQAMREVDKVVSDFAKLVNMKGF